MSEFDEIYSLKNGVEKTQKIIEYLKTKINIESWLTNNFKYSIIHFKDRTEYKKNNQYHRLNGPAIDYNDEKLNKYYYRGEFFESKIEWEKATIKELRKIKIKKLNKKENPE